MRAVLARWFWPVFRAGAGLAFAFMVMVAAGGPIEQAVSPVVDGIVLDEARVTRTATHACWYWEADKRKMRRLANVDTFLDRVDGKRTFPEITDDGVAWGAGDARPMGHVTHTQCIPVPDDLRRSGAPFVLRIRPWFTGATPLWQVPVQLPDVIVPSFEPVAPTA